MSQFIFSFLMGFLTQFIAILAELTIYYLPKMYLTIAFNINVYSRDLVYIYIYIYIFKILILKPTGPFSLLTYNAFRLSIT